MGVQETKLTSKIEKWWSTKGSMVLKFHGNEFTRIGTSDLVICYKGRFIALEVKVLNNKPTPVQHEFIRQIVEWYGGIGEWVNEENWEKESIRIKEEIDGI